MKQLKALRYSQSASLTPSQRSNDRTCAASTLGQLICRSQGSVDRKKKGKNLRKQGGMSGMSQGSKTPFSRRGTQVLHTRLPTTRSRPRRFCTRDRLERYLLMNFGRRATRPLTNIISQAARIAAARRRTHRSPHEGSNGLKAT